MRALFTRSGIAGILAVALLVPSPVAADTLDLSIPDWDDLGGFGTDNPNAIFGQTFVAGLTGNLTRVQFEGDAFWSSGLFEFNVLVYEVSGGIPTTVLGATTVTAASVGYTGWDLTRNFSFSPTVAIVAGSEYAVALQPVQGYVGWKGSSSNVYSGGAAVFYGVDWGQRSDLEFALQTYVDTNAAVPEPGAMLLWGLGVASFFLTRRRT